MQTYTAPFSTVVSDLATLAGTPLGYTYYGCKPSTTKADKYECQKQQGPSHPDDLNYHSLIHTMVVLGEKPMVLHRPFVPTCDTKETWSSKSEYYICERPVDSAKTICHLGQFKTPEQDGRKHDVRVPNAIPEYHHQRYIQHVYWPHFDIKESSYT